MKRESFDEMAYVAGEDERLYPLTEYREQLKQQQESVHPRGTYLVELSGEPIPLETIEFRILMFLSAKPYRAFTRDQIAKAVRSEHHPVTAQSLDGFIRTLRDKLGIMSDYIQSVPYVGYRFKE